MNKIITFLYMFITILFCGICIVIAGTGTFLVIKGHYHAGIKFFFLDFMVFIAAIVVSGLWRMNDELSWREEK